MDGCWDRFPASVHLLERDSASALPSGDDKLFVTQRCFEFRIRGNLGASPAYPM